MITYRDMTFCKSDCIDSKCPRFLSEEEKRSAKLPIAWSDFSKSCPDYTKIVKPNATESGNDK